MRLSTVFMFLLIGYFFAKLCYVPMPAEMAAHTEFFWKTAGFKFGTTLMYLKYLYRGGGSIIDFSVLQNALTLLATAYPHTSSVTNGSEVTISDTTFDGVRVFVLQTVDRKREKSPALVFFHGGGLTIGSADVYKLPMLETTQLLEDIVVVSVDYRLAPEHPFPAAYDDAVAATKWLLTHPDEYGIDPTRVAVAGDSAGGYLVAAVAQAINDDPSVPNIKLQVLLYPWLNHFDFQTPSYQKNAHYFGLDTWIQNRIMGFCFSAYFNGKLNDSLVVEMVENRHTSPAFKNSIKYGKIFNHSLIPESFRDPAYYTPPASSSFGDESIWDDIKDFALDIRVSPILREDMIGLPSAYIATCGFDPLRDDGIFYYHRLKEAGVSVEWVNHEEAFHSVDWFGPMASESGKRLRTGFVEFIKKNI